MKYISIYLICINFSLAQKTIPFSIDIRPRVIDNAKIIVNVEVINNVDRPVDYLEGFLSEYNNENTLLEEKRMVLVYHYEPALEPGFATTKTSSYDLRFDIPSTFKFNISKVKFTGDNRVFAWHSKSGFIRID